MKFLDRQRELQALDQFLEAPGAGLLILFGRRRVGKTRLLTHFLERREVGDALFWTATTHGAAVQLRNFSQALLEHDPRFEGPPAPDFAFPDWAAALNHLGEIAEGSAQRRLVILDEFTYLIRGDPAVTSVFQNVWDRRLSRISRLKLVLTGSLVGMMEKEVLASRAPLYGRATALLRLRPLPYASLLEVFGRRKPAERVAIYAVAGGIPAYLELFTRAPRFSAGLRDQCLGPGSVMLTDPALILHEQLPEPQTYESILWAIAGGAHTWAEIARTAGLAENSLGHYLKVLQELELIERRDPILSSPRGRRGRYRVRDPFLRFYYRFIVPQITNIERGYLAAAVDKISAELPGFIGAYVFEELCREWVLAAAAVGELGFQPEAVGAYWRVQRGEGVQLDVVAANPREKRLLIGEAKWGRGTVSRKVLTDLVERSRRMPQVAEGWSTEYAVFGRANFSAAAREAAEMARARLLTLPDLERTLAKAIR